MLRRLVMVALLASLMVGLGLAPAQTASGSTVVEGPLHVNEARDAGCSFRGQTVDSVIQSALLGPVKFPLQFCVIHPITVSALP